MGPLKILHTGPSKTIGWCLPAIGWLKAFLQSPTCCHAMPFLKPFVRLVVCAHKNPFLLVFCCYSWFRFMFFFFDNFCRPLCRQYLHSTVAAVLSWAPLLPTCGSAAAAAAEPRCGCALTYAALYLRQADDDDDDREERVGGGGGASQSPPFPPSSALLCHMWL